MAKPEAAESSSQQERTIKRFTAMVTRKQRNALEEGEFGLLENIQPVGEANLVSTPGPGATLAVLPVSTVNKIFGENIGGTPYLIIFGVNGQCWSLNLTTNALVSIAAAGVFDNPRDVALWQGAALLVIDNTKGYFAWGMVAAAPTVAIGAAGVVNVGQHSWVVTFVTPSGETSQGNSSVQLNLAVASIVNLTNVPLGPPAATSRKIYRRVAGDTGNYLLVGTIADNTTTTFADNIADAGLGAAAPTGLGSIIVVDSTKIGQSIAVYAGKVWVCNNRTFTHSVANSLVDFFSLGSGSFLLTDSAFIGNVTKLLASLDVLWVFGEASANQISNVQVTGGITTFSNVNVSSSIGTTFPLSVQSYLRQIFLANPYGVYAQIGVTPERLSTDIDNTFALVDQTKPVLGAVGVLNGIICYLLFVTYKDPVLGSRPVMLTYFDKKWFITSQGNNLTAIASLEIAGKYRVFGTDGTSFFELFTTAGFGVHTLQSPLFDFENAILGKDLLRLQIAINSGVSLSATVNGRSELGVLPGTTIVAANTLIFVGTSPITFIGVSPITFIGAGLLLSRFMMSTHGKLVGFDLSLNSDPFTISSYSMEILDRELW